MAWAGSGTNSTITGCTFPYNTTHTTHMQVVESIMCDPDEWFHQHRDMDRMVDVFWNPYTNERCNVNTRMFDEIGRGVSYFELYGKKAHPYPYKKPDHVSVSTKHPVRQSARDFGYAEQKDIALFKHIEDKFVKWNLEYRRWEPTGFKNKLQYELNKKTKDVVKGLKGQKPLNVKIKEIV